MTGDILDVVGLEEAMQGMDLVIHAAAMVSFLPQERRELFKTNIEGTANVVNTALAQHIRRLVYVSSVAALGRGANGAEVDEGKQWQDSQFNTRYAISKYLAEMEVWRAIGEGLEAIIVNPSTILGFGDWNGSSCTIFKMVYENFSWYTNGVNGFVDVEDVARAIRLLLESGISGERFILSGENWSFRDLFNCIADGFGKKHPNREATPLLSQLAWRMEKVKSFLTNTKPLLSKETALIGQTKTYFTHRKIENQLPDFRFTPLRESIQKACEAYLSEIKK